MEGEREGKSKGAIQMESGGRQTDRQTNKETETDKEKTNQIKDKLFTQYLKKITFPLGSCGARSIPCKVKVQSCDYVNKSRAQVSLTLTT